MEDKAVHLPVLVDEVISLLSPVDGGVYVDGNLGLGGHSGALLAASSPGGRVIGFDWDSQALELAEKRLAPYGERLITVRRNFADMAEVLALMGIDGVDGILLDLGLSSLQLDVSGRGFSFQGSEPLDMRMDQRRPMTASRLLATCSQEELADIFFYYGEERQARRIASYIVEARGQEPLLTTDQLVAIVERAIPKKFHPRKIHVATRVFQALRIAVNGELDNLQKILADGSGMLKVGGRFAVISFHSLEDRLVKREFRRSRELEVLTSKPVKAVAAEVQGNPRARSACLRVAEKRREVDDAE